jgi:hypothetical protein
MLSWHNIRFTSLHFNIELQITWRKFPDCFDVINFLKIVLLSKIFSAFNLFGLSNLSLCSHSHPLPYLHISTQVLIIQFVSAWLLHETWRSLGNGTLLLNYCITKVQYCVDCNPQDVEQPVIKGQHLWAIPDPFLPECVKWHCTTITMYSFLSKDKPLTLRLPNRKWLFCFKAFFKYPTQSQRAKKENPRENIWRAL